MCQVFYLATAYQAVACAFVIYISVNAIHASKIIYMSAATSDLNVPPKAMPT